MILTSPKDNERDICLRLLARVNRTGPLTVIGDKATPAANSKPTPPPWTPRSSDLAAKTSPDAARTSRRSDNGSNRSIRPRKTSSPSNDTAPAPCTDSTP